MFKDIVQHTLLKRKKPAVYVHVVTFNHAATIALTLQSVLEQRDFSLGEDLFVRVTDNHSSDESAEIVRRQFPQLELICRDRNDGFCDAHNRGVTDALERGADYVLVLNPDVRLARDALGRLVEALEQDGCCGAVCPKLYRADDQLEPVSPPTLDSTGMFITPALRHFDRGSQEIDTGRFDGPQYVFGASGAAVLLRREFILDAALRRSPESRDLELFDPAFFAYREDADLAWRGQRLGWSCRYAPEAVGYHKRVVLPERRRKLPAELNRLGVRNRFLLQLNNFHFAANFHCLLPALWRNLLVVGAACTTEASSFLGLCEAAAGAGRALRNRRAVQRRARVRGRELKKWFRNDPYVEPALSFCPAGEPIKSIKAVVVNYNSGSRLEACLASLAEAAKILAGQCNLAVCTVDNASEDLSAAAAAARFGALTGFEFHLSKDNLGFAGAINAAATGEFDALLVLNPDCTIDAASVRALRDVLDRSREVGIASPILYGLDGRPQHGFIARRLPTISSTLSELFFLHRIWPGNPWTAKYLMLDDSRYTAYLESREVESGGPYFRPGVPVIVEQPAGACMLIRRSAFEELGGFDASFWPAWFEDVDFAARLKQSGRLAVITSSAHAVHEGGYSTHVLSSSRFYEIWYSNMLRYWRKHGTASRYLALRSALVPALLLRALAAFAAFCYSRLRGNNGLRAAGIAGALFRLALDPDRSVRSRDGLEFLVEHE